ncbi:MAG: helix-turn-helix domain-containing protein [Lachnospiraceae bacterium]|nr:helix-turn-helix domain-containing protein [Lachnospiraceae bacterium]
MVSGREYEDFNRRSGKRILEIRTRRQYSRECLSELAGISAKFLYDIEMGRKGCSAYIMYCLASALGTSVDYLLGIDEDDGTQIEELCRMFHGEQKESLAAILRIMQNMMQTI